MRELAKWEKRTHYIYCVHFATALCLRAFLVSSFEGSRVVKLTFIIFMIMVLSLVSDSMDKNRAYIRQTSVLTLFSIDFINKAIFLYFISDWVWTLSNSEVFYLFCLYSNTFVMTPFIPSAMLKNPFVAFFNTRVYYVNVKGSYLVLLE